MFIIEANIQSTDDKIKVINYAIDNKYVIAFWYRGKKLKDPKQRRYTKQNWRRAEPVQLGYSVAPPHSLMLRAYQIDGATNSKNKAWKTFLVDEMSSVVAIDMESIYKPFDKPTGSNYNANGDKKMLPNILRKIDLLKKHGDIKKINTEPEDETPDQDSEEPEQNNKPEQEPVSESSGFLKWIYNFYGSRQNNSISSED